MSSEKDEKQSGPPKSDEEFDAWWPFDDGDLDEFEREIEESLQDYEPVPDPHHEVKKIRAAEMARRTLAKEHPGRMTEEQEQQLPPGLLAYWRGEAPTPYTDPTGWAEFVDTAVGDYDIVWLASSDTDQRGQIDTATVANGDSRMVLPTAIPNRLYFGDNLDILRQYVPDESVDLIYLDPPFNSNATYNILFRERSGEESAAQITAFEDTWHWGWESETAFQEVVTRWPGKVGSLLTALRQFLGQNDMMAYLTMMAQRMIELHRVLKPTGSIYLHCDPTASHYLKLLLDAVFGAENFRNEIVWKRTYSHNDPKRYGRISDSLLFYTKSGVYTWNTQYLPYAEDYVNKFYRNEDEGGKFQSVTLTGPGVRDGESGEQWRGYNPTDSGRHWSVPRRIIRSIAGEAGLNLSINERLDLLDEHGYIYWPPNGDAPRLKQYLREMSGVPVQNIWTDVDRLSAHDRERLGYPTQKPEALLERIISASSNEGDVVLDPFCGCGTATVAAERLNRRWIGIDITHLAITLVRHRLHDSFGDDLRPYEIVGQPTDSGSAAALAEQDRYQFEWWALGLVDARPANDMRRGADAGVDGYINFFDDASGKPKRIIAQVKSGHVNRGMIATLKGDMEREKAEIGVFITLQPPTEPMRQEALSAGIYTPEHFPDQQHPRVQILTIDELLAGAGVSYPRGGAPATFRQAPRRRRSQGRQSNLV